MKKCLIALTGLFCISLSGYSQDYGYRTFDIGAEYQYTKSGPSYNLQVAFNSEEHHSIVLRAGYNIATGQTTPTHNNEEGSGWSGSLGYRYYFSVLPKRFFIGARAAVAAMDIQWSIHATNGSSKLMVLQPAVETGYTLLINDMFFITPHISAGIQTTLNNKGEKVTYGNGFLPGAGISMGWRF
jgi:Protein of unknown function (DUF3575)